MPKTTEKPDKVFDLNRYASAEPGLNRRIPDAWWNSEARFAVELTWRAMGLAASRRSPAFTFEGATFAASIHYAACFLPRIASALSRLDCEARNRELTEREEKRRERLDRDAEAIARSIGATAVRQHDPRGLPLYLNFPGMVDESQPNWSFQTDRMLAVPVK